MVIVTADLRVGTSNLKFNLRNVIYTPRTYTHLLHHACNYRYRCHVYRGTQFQVRNQDNFEATRYKDLSSVSESIGRQTHNIHKDDWKKKEEKEHRGKILRSNNFPTKEWYINNEDDD